MVSVAYEVSKWREKLVMWFVWALPSRIIYYAGIRLWANGTSGEFSMLDVNDLSCSDAIGQWEKGRGGDKCMKPKE